MTKRKQPWELLNQSTMERQKRHIQLQKQIDGLTKAQEENKACEDEDAVIKELNEYSAYLEQKQQDANEKKKKTLDENAWNRKPHVDVSLNKKIEEYIDDDSKGKSQK